MPIPIGGLGQHYGVDADEYFATHDLEAKDAACSALLRQSSELLGGTGRLLDIGAGRGEMLRVAVRDGWSAVGIEPSPTFAEYAARYAGAEIRRETVEHCDFPADSFDVVMLSAVLEHLYDPNATVREIARILRSAGLLYIDVPNEEALYFKVGNLYQRLRGRDWVVNLSPTFSPYHTFGFSKRSLTALLNKHGLDPAAWNITSPRLPFAEVGGLFGKIEPAFTRGVMRLGQWMGRGTEVEVWARKR
jgi:SAM-dependent methyltransferase